MNKYQDLKQGIGKPCFFRLGRTKHGLHKHPLYKTWIGIKDRCHNQNSTSYKKYGARGIKVEKIWREDFSKFFEWATNNGWSSNLQLDRKNNSKNYSPSNCRWVTCKVNCNNKRNNLRVVYKGKTKTFQEVFDEIGHPTINSRIALHRYKNKENLTDACTRPLEINRKRNQFRVIKIRVLRYLEKRPQNWLSIEEHINDLIKDKNSSYTRQLLSRLKSKGILVNKNNLWSINV